MGRIIDTSVLIELERRGDPLQALLSTYPNGEVFGIASITASEMLAGVLRAAPRHRTRRSVFVEETLRVIPVIPFDLALARVHARTGQEVSAAGTKIGAYDLIIAATAIFLDYALATFNVREFSQVARLRVEQPRW